MKNLSWVGSAMRCTPWNHYPISNQICDFRNNFSVLPRNFVGLRKQLTRASNSNIRSCQYMVMTRKWFLLIILKLQNLPYFRLKTRFENHTLWRPTYHKAYTKEYPPPRRVEQTAVYPLGNLQAREYIKLSSRFSCVYPRLTGNSFRIGKGARKITGEWGFACRVCLFA